MLRLILLIIFFFFNDTATTEIYTLSLHDALPISGVAEAGSELPCFGRQKGKMFSYRREIPGPAKWASKTGFSRLDRKSTRLNSSHGYISYAVFCLKKKKTKLAYDYSNTSYASALT